MADLGENGWILGGKIRVNLPERFFTNGPKIKGDSQAGSKNPNGW